MVRADPFGQHLRRQAHASAERHSTGSNLHRTCIELYRRHHDPDHGNGWCPTCGQQTPCTSRRRAALVIRAAGEDPRWYDDHLPSALDPNPALPMIGEPWPSQPRYPASAPRPGVRAEPANPSETIGYAINSSDVYLVGSFSPDEER